MADTARQTMSSIEQKKRMLQATGSKPFVTRFVVFLKSSRMLATTAMVPPAVSIANPGSVMVAVAAKLALCMAVCLKR